MGKLIPFQPPPGVFKNGTAYQAKGRWSDCNLVRWKDGRLQPLGGWEKVIDPVGAAISGIGRAMTTWRDLTGARWMAIGTNSNLYIFTSLSGSASDITPVAASSTTDLVVGDADGSIGLGFGTGDFGGTETRKTITGTDITFTAPATISSSSTSFTDAATDATAPGVGADPFGVGDEIEITGSSESANNKTYPLSHRIVTVSANSMTVGPTNGSAVYSSSGIVSDPAAGNGSVTIRRARRFGNENVARSSLVLHASSWIFDIFGENLLGMSTADGRIFQWDPTTSNPTANKAVVIAGAPINNSAILVSKQRHLFALGAGGNKRKIQWSDAESLIVWGATPTNQAGSFEIDSSGEIMAAKTVGDRILVWTSTDLHAVDFVGMPYIYGRKKIGDACGAISNRSMIAVGDQAFWMAQGGFFQYQGSVQPLKCDVQDHIFKDINRVQDSKIYASINPEFFEVTWWYASSTSDEILKYASYNYSEGWWSVGELCRTAFATGSPGVFDKPIGIADDGTVYEHEIDVSSGKRTTNQVPLTNADVSDYDRKLVTGTDSTTDEGLCFAETVMEIGDGDNVTNISQLITDTASVGDNGLRFKFKTKYTPNGTESTSTNYDVTSDGYVDVREQGRQFTYRVESGWDQYWEIGSIRANMSTGGRR